MMYADAFVDLLTIDISNINDPQTLCRQEDVFNNFGFDEQRGYLIDWTPTENRIQVDCSDPNFGDEFFNRGGGWFGAEDTNIQTPTAGGGGNQAQSGEGGSLAKFSLVNGYLYVINNFELSAYDLSNPSKPALTEILEVGWNIETLFPYKEFLFIGSQTGVFIYSIAEPQSPSYVSEFSHAQACDPVFVKDDIAYITLREGTWCQNFTNQLDVLDVSNIFSPQLVKSYEMDHPHGLSVTLNNLYLCEGSHGLKVFDVSDLEAINENQLDHLEGFDAYDVIALGDDHLLVVGQDGLYQFDSSDPSELVEISFIGTSE